MRQIVEESLILDINDLKKRGIIKPGVDLRDILQVKTLRIEYQALLADETAPRIHLEYRIGGNVQTYLIPLNTTRPNYGGQRWWFVCPVSGKRAAKLYLPLGGKIFARREAYNLAHQTENLTPVQRALKKAEKIRLKLGDNGVLLDPFPKKPPKMRWKTYYRIHDEFETALENAIGITTECVARQFVRLGIEPPPEGLSRVKD